MIVILKNIYLYNQFFQQEYIVYLYHYIWFLNSLLINRFVLKIWFHYIHQYHVYHELHNHLFQYLIDFLCSWKQTDWFIRGVFTLLLVFYSLSIIEFTYFMYKIVNKVTFMVSDTIKVIIKINIKLINTTSLSDNQSYLSAVATHIYYNVHFLCQLV